MNTDIYNTNNIYDLIYTDPPWTQSKGGLRKTRPNQTRYLDYNTLTLREIQCIHHQVSTICSDKHNIFMWTIDKYLHDTELMMNDLGYSLHARFVWDKINGIAPAFTVRFSHEYLLWFYKKGRMLKPVKEQRGKYTTVLREQSTIHSKKPMGAYDMIENMFPDAKKLELFARYDRPGWDRWGKRSIRLIPK